VLGKFKKAYMYKSARPIKASFENKQLTVECHGNEMVKSFKGASDVAVG